MKRTMLAAALATVGLFTSPSGVLAQQLIFLVRHAEQTPGPDEPVLTEAGHRRAAALVGRLKDAGITAIYTSDAKRTIETAAPLARALGITPKVLPMRAIEGLIDEVRRRHAGDRVLIVNHALNLPALLKALGHAGEVSVAVNDYEPIFVVVPRPDGPPVVMLLRY